MQISLVGYMHILHLAWRMNKDIWQSCSIYSSSVFLFTLVYCHILLLFQHNEKILSEFSFAFYDSNLIFKTCFYYFNPLLDFHKFAGRQTVNPAACSFASTNNTEASHLLAKLHLYSRERRRWRRQSSDASFLWFRASSPFTLHLQTLNLLLSFEKQTCLLWLPAGPHLPCHRKRWPHFSHRCHGKPIFLLLILDNCSFTPQENGVLLLYFIIFFI